VLYDALEIRLLARIIEASLLGRKSSAFAPQPPNLGGSESLTVPQNGGCSGRVQDIADSCKRSIDRGHKTFAPIANFRRIRGGYD
jgi:hypothetical protein